MRKAAGNSSGIRRGCRQRKSVLRTGQARAIDQRGNHLQTFGMPSFLALSGQVCRVGSVRHASEGLSLPLPPLASVYTPGGLESEVNVCVPIPGPPRCSVATSSPCTSSSAASLPLQGQDCSPGRPGAPDHATAPLRDYCPLLVAPSLRFTQSCCVCSVESWSVCEGDKAWERGNGVRGGERRGGVLRGAHSRHTARRCRHGASWAEATLRKSVGDCGLLFNLHHIFTTLSEIWEITLKCFLRREDEIESPVSNRFPLGVPDQFVSASWDWL